jgi:hypothetical protein
VQYGKDYVGRFLALLNHNLLEGSKDRQNTTDFCVMQTLLVSRRHVSAFVGHLQVSKLDEK